MDFVMFTNDVEGVQQQQQKPSQVDHFDKLNHIEFCFVFSAKGNGIYI